MFKAAASISNVNAAKTIIHFFKLWQTIYNIGAQSLYSKRAVNCELKREVWCYITYRHSEPEEDFRTTTVYIVLYSYLKQYKIQPDIIEDHRPATLTATFIVNI